MSNTILRNENVSVTLKSLGGELTSIKDASGTEYLWQGNPEACQDSGTFQVLLLRRTKRRMETRRGR